MRALKRFLLLFIGMGALFALFYPVENWLADRAMVEHLDWLKSKGESFDASPFDPRKLADADNAALAPCFECFYQMTPGEGKRQWVMEDLDEIPESLPVPQKEALEGWLKLKHGVAVLKRFPKLKDGPIDFDAALQVAQEEYDLKFSDAADSMMPAEFSKTAPSSLVAFSEFFRQFAPLLNQLKEASKRQDCRWPSKDQPNGGSPANEVAFLIHKALAMEARLALLRKESDKALESTLAQVRFAAFPSPQNDLVGGLMQTGLIGSSGSLLEECLGANLWKDDEWQAIADSLPRRSPASDFKECLRGSRAKDAAYFASKSWNEMVAPEGRELYPRPSRYYFYGPSGWKTRNLISFSMQAQTMIDLMGDSQMFPAPKLLAMMDPPTRVSPHNFMAKVNRAGYVKLMAMIFSAYDKFQLISVAVAVQRFRLKYKKLPDQLEEIVPGFMPELPHSYFDARAPSYRLLPNGSFNLWFFGIDGDDDGGLVPAKAIGGEDGDLVVSPVLISN